MKIDLKDIPVDPKYQKSIDEYHVNQRDEIRRAYLIGGPFQPKNHNFNVRDIGGNLVDLLAQGLMIISIGWNIV